MENLHQLPTGLTIKYEAFKVPQAFINTIRKVYTCPKFPDFKTTHRIKCLCQSLEKELLVYSKAREEAYSHYNKIKQEIENKKTLKEEVPAELIANLAEAETVGRTKVDSLHQIKVPLKWYGLNEMEINCVEGLTPADIEVLEYVMDPDVLKSLIQ